MPRSFQLDTYSLLSSLSSTVDDDDDDVGYVVDDDDDLVFLVGRSNIVIVCICLRIRIDDDDVQLRSMLFIIVFFFVLVLKCLKPNKKKIQTLLYLFRLLSFFFDLEACVCLV